MSSVLWLALGGVAGAFAATLICHRRQVAGKLPVEPHAEASTADLAVAARCNTRLQTALDALPIGVIVADSDGDIVVRNHASATIGDDANAHVLVHAAVQHHLREVLKGGARTQTVELYGPPRRVVVVNAVSLDGHGAVATVEDITERARLDAVRTDFVANISHELKTPIGALAVLAETLVDEPDPVVLRRLASKTVDEAHRVASTIDDLLELSRIELSGELNLRTVEVGSLISAAIARSNYLAASRSVQVVVGDVPTVCKVQGDQVQLESALGNLVDNAVKFSESGGTVTISAESGSTDVVLQVADTGIGIPAHDLDRIFERFYRVDRARSRATGGTGLGLSIVRHVAQNHSGTVSVTSRVGEGSVFRLALPIVQPTSERQPS